MLVEIYIKVNLCKGSSMDMEKTNGLMVQSIRDSGSTTYLKEKENIYGQMAKSILEPGKPI